MKIVTIIFSLLSLHFFYTPFGYCENIVINEIMSSNRATIADEDGDYVDWIEIYNPTSQTVNLANYALSDDKKNPAKWSFPEITINPHDFLLIFASDKNRKEILIWDTIIQQGDIWFYCPGTQQPPNNWRLLDFNGENWDTGPSGFGYGDGDDATVINNSSSIFIRKTFDITNITSVSRLLLHVDYDDAFVAYLNGREIARKNIGQPNEYTPFDAFANSGHEALIGQGLLPELFHIEHPEKLLNKGTNVLALQVHNVSSTSSDMTLIPFLSIGWKDKPNFTPRYCEILGLKSLQFHTNFKIKSAGEALYLFESQIGIVDSVTSRTLPIDISYGRLEDGGRNWAQLAFPTPGESNINSIYTSRTSAPLFSCDGGFFTQPVQVELSDTSGGDIYYTLDGSEPSQQDLNYSTPLKLSQTTVIRAKSYKENFESSRVITNTYIFNETSSFPIICLTTDPYNLYDEEHGIFAMGANASPEDPNYGANFWQDWERPVFVEFYESNSQSGFKLDAGMKVFGGWSRARPQKSVAIFQRKIYDDRTIDYQLFPDKDIYHFESFILRNGGNDWDGTLFRDGFMQYLVKDVMNLETMAFRPVTVYLNGEYWGMLNMREKINEHFIAANRGHDPDKVDILDQTGQGVQEIMAGSNEDYLKLWNFLETHDMTQPAHFDSVARVMDIDNFIDYMTAEIYIGNTDWPGNNIKYYKPQIPGGKWRWLIYDTDFGFYLYDTSYRHNTLQFATEPNGPGWPNPPWSTFILRTLLENRYFQKSFINRFADHINTTFDVDRIIDILYEFVDMIEPELERHRDRWPTSAGQFYSRLDRMETFAELRPSYARNFILNQFNLEKEINIRINVDPAHAGSIKINSITIHHFPWQGVYFKNVPITISAIPEKGYSFISWSHATWIDSISTCYSCAQDLDLVVKFSKSVENPNSVVINEINYNSSRFLNSKEWIELYNFSDTSIGLGGWQLHDAKKEAGFRIPSETTLSANNFIIISKDTVRLKATYPGIKNYLGNMEFELGNAADTLYLYDSNGLLIDSLAYSDSSPWPVNADGEGYTLELVDSGSDNAHPQNWAASTIFGGTPGSSNSTVTLVDNTRQATPIQCTLEQNIPNPFNSSTTISYNLAFNGYVELTIYDIRGRLVSTLVKEFQAPGQYNILWDKNVASGIYFYRLEVNGNQNYYKVKKMAVIK